MNKINGGDGIPVELIQILKDDAIKVLHSISQQIWKTQHWPQDWKRSVYIPISKKGNVKHCSNYCTIALISHASKVMCLLFNMLSRLVIAFLPRSKHLIILWLQSPSAVILEPKKRKSVTTSTFAPSICHAVITHLEPDILESKVKWALESITTNKASGGDGIPVVISNPER